MIGVAALLPYLPTILSLLGEVGQRFTGEKGDRIIRLTTGALSGGARELAAVQEIKAMKAEGREPTDADLDRIVGDIESGSDRLNAAVEKIVEGG